MGKTCNPAPRAFPLPSQADGEQSSFVQRKGFQDLTHILYLCVSVLLSFFFLITDTAVIEVNFIPSLMVLSDTAGP